MTLLSKTRHVIALILAIALSACGGGGGSPSSGTVPPTNSAPAANAGLDLTVAEGEIVTLDGGGSRDTDVGDTLTYVWTLTDPVGDPVALSDPTAVSPTFTAVLPGAYIAELTVNDGTASSSDTVNITVTEAQDEVTIAGKLFYEFVPPSVIRNQCDGLNFAGTVERPIRWATVQLLDVNDNDNVLVSTLARDDGTYSFSGIDAGIDVRVRVRAELISEQPDGWEVYIRDNVDDPQAPRALKERPVYVVQWQPFNTGTADIRDKNFTARTGWSGSAYAGVRAAAPFAILDAIYAAMDLIVSVDPAATFNRLDAFWSVNNKKVPHSPDIDTGELTSAFYNSGLEALFLFGDESTETDEFDDHLVLHEWTHYFEDNLSRSDSIGGPHFLGESLDLRLAFGEGFAHALAAIVLDEPQYCDTGAVPSGAGSFGFNTETNTSGMRGWFNEMSVATFIYDLWDAGSDDGADSGSIGFRPIYDTMAGPQKMTPAFTTIFSFAAELRSMLPEADRAFVDAQLNRENIDAPSVDIWGDGQTTTPFEARNNGRDLTPIYTEIPADGSIVNVCINNDYRVEGVVNKLSDWRYLKFTTPTAGTWRITAQANPVPPPTNDPPIEPTAEDPNPEQPRDRSDPDFYSVWRQGSFVTSSRGPDADIEIMEHPFDAATYVIEMQEWRHEDDGAATDFPAQVCFDLSMVAL